MACKNWIAWLLPLEILQRGALAQKIYRHLHPETVCHNNYKRLWKGLAITCHFGQANITIKERHFNVYSQYLTDIVGVV